MDPIAIYISDIWGAYIRDTVRHRTRIVEVEGLTQQHAYRALVYMDITRHLYLYYIIRE